MGIPSGDSPQKAQQYYHYLQGHQETLQRPDTWHVHWLDLAWLWGFVIALLLVILLWLRQYRTTRQRTGITTEMAGPSTFFFLLLTLILAGWAVVLTVGHIVWGQKF
jgi:hypothetical protein